MNKPGLTKQEQPYFVKAFEGQDTATKELSLTNKGVIAQNCRYNSEFGSVVKRLPLAYYNSTPESSPIQSAYRYYRKSNDTAYLIQINGNNIRVGNDAAGTFSTLRTLASSSGYRFTAVTYNDLAIISTGNDPIVQTDGTVGWELGSCKATGIGTSGNVNVGTHYYAITFTVTEAGNPVEHINGAISNTITIASSAKQVTLDNIPIGPTACTARNIYRTSAGGSTLKLIHTIANNSDTTYTDNIADGNGTTMPAVTDDVPKGKYLYVEGERLFITGDPNHANTVYYSDLYLPHYIPTGSSDLSTVPASDFYDLIGQNDNDVITGMARYLGITFVFKQNSIRPYYITGTPDTWTLGGVIADTQGSPAPYTIKSTPYGIAYQGWDYFYIFNGNFSVPMTISILVKNDISKARMTQSVAEFQRGQLMVAFTDASLGHQYHDRVMIYDFVTKELSIDKGGNRLGGGSVNINCFAPARGGDDEGQLYAGDGVVGYMYKYEDGTEIIRYSTQSDLNTGSHSNTCAINTEINPILTRYTIDDMEYPNDTLAQAAWVTSTATASTFVPPDLGTGIDGTVTVSSPSAWVTATNYVTRDMVKQSGMTYVCQADHTSGTFATDLATGKWVTTLSTNAWVTAHNYAIGSVVAQSGNNYYCLVTHSSGTFATDLAAWLLIEIAKIIYDDMNYASLTINAGKAVIASAGVTIRCLGTITVTGVIMGADTSVSYNMYAQTITISSGGIVTSAYMRCNTLNNSGTITEILIGATAVNPDASAYQHAFATGGAYQTVSVSPMVSFPSCTVSKVVYSISTSAQENPYYARNSFNTEKVSLQINGVWTDIVSVITGPVGGNVDRNTAGTLTTGWSGVTGIQAYGYAQAQSSHDMSATAWVIICAAYASTLCDYVNSSGTVPATGDTSDFVAPLQVFSDTNIVIEGNYSLKVICPPGSNTLNGTITKTITLKDMSPVVYDTILIDVYALRSGTQMQFGIGETAGTDNLVNLPITAPNTWETVALDFSGVSDASKDAIIKCAFKFINTDSANIVYIDNIRPAIPTATWTSPVLNINAYSFGDMYWNEFLGAYGTVAVYTRNGNTDALCQAASWGTALTTPAGSQIISTGGSTDPADMKYFQVKVVLTTTQTQTPDPDYAQFPYLLSESNYVLKFEYYKTFATAETSVEQRYRTGFRNFDQPLMDKIYKKLISVHEGTAGIVTLSYWLDNQTDPDYVYTIDLAQNPRMWESFFPDTAFGRAISVEWYKNDLEDFKIKQFGALVIMEPII